LILSLVLSQADKRQQPGEGRSQKYSKSNTEETPQESLPQDGLLQAND
jgi:hypothetical protein